MDKVDEENLEKVGKLYSEMNAAKDRKEDALVEMVPHSNWDHMLSPAPMAIAVLGQVMIISAENDFSLTENPPKGGFTHLKYPKSFRTSLVQISNIGWEAFNLADTNMDQIRLHTSNADTHVKNLVKVLVKGTRKEVDYMSPNIMNRLKNIAEECVTLSKTVEDKFVYFMNVTGELLEASTNAKGVYEDKIKETQSAILVAKEEGKLAEEEKLQLNEEYSKMKDEIEKAEDEVKKAYESAPGSFKLAALGMLDHVGNTLSSITNVFKFTFKKERTSHNGGDADPVTVPSPDVSSTGDKIVGEAVQQISQKLTILASISSAANDRSDDTNVLFVKKSLQSITENLMKCVNVTLPPTGDKVLLLCQRGISLCDELMKMNNSIQVRTNNEKEDLTKNVFDLLKESGNLVTEIGLFHPAPSTAPRGPCMSKRKYDSNPSLVLTEMEKYKMKVDHKTCELERSRQQHENIRKEMKERNEKIMQTLIEMSTLDTKRINFDQIRNMLVEGLKAIGEVRKQWGLLVGLFQRMANTVKIKMSDEVGSLIENAEFGRKQILGGEIISDLTRDLIYEQAHQASSVAYLVHALSSTYVEVSSKHLMEGIGGLGGLIALDPTTDKQRIEDEKKKLFDNCTQAQKEIQEIAEMQRQKYEEYIDKRMQQLQEIKPLLPIPSSADTDVNIEEDDLSQFA